jgi:hypothetical protein
MTARLVAAASAAILALVPVADAAKRTVKAPKSGQYNGSPRGKALTLYVSGKSIQLAAFGFACAGSSGRTSLNDVRLKKTTKGYKFGISAHGSITFADNYPDQNGAIELYGRFSLDGKSAKGTFRVKSPRCHDTGSIKWRAHR